MSLLNDLTRLSNINADIFKITQTQIKFFIKSERCLTPIKRETSVMHHNHHHANTDLKDDYYTKKNYLQIDSTGNIITMFRNKTLRNLQEQYKVFKPLKLNKSHQITLFNP
jgi:hypothetical protein